MAIRTNAVFYVNGLRHEAGPAQMELMLADYLREVRRLTGTKIVCAEGDCGACSVLVARPGVTVAPSTKYKSNAGKRAATPVFAAVNACIMRVGHCDGASIVTVEGLGSSAAPSEVQRAVCQSNGSQCGFCTPGFIVALAALTDRRKAEHCEALTAQDAKHALTGNLCRCTGYAPILQGATDIDLDRWQLLAKRFMTRDIAADLSRGAKVAIVPPAKPKAKTANAAKRSAAMPSSSAPMFAFAAPTKRADVSAYLKQGFRIVSGGTDVGVQVNKGKTSAAKVLSLHLISDLYAIEAKGNTLTIGALVSVASLRRAIETRFAALAGYLDIFASPQIKNVATVVGNIANGSPIGDATTALMACAGAVRVEGGRGGKARWVPLAELYSGYRQMRLVAGEWIAGLRIELPSARDQVAFFKTSQRRDLDISAVNAGLWITTNGQGAIDRCRLAVGGVGPTIVRLAAAETLLAGKTLPLTETARHEVIAAIGAHIAPLSDLRGSAAFRRVVLNNWIASTLQGWA